MPDLIAHTLLAGGLLVVLPMCYQRVLMQSAKPDASDRTLTRLHEYPTDLTVTDFTLTDYRRN